MFVLISYDISDDKRRTKIHKTLKDFGTWIQYSVFECELKEKEYLQLRYRLKKKIDITEDNIRFYFLCKKCQDKIEKIGDQNSPIEESVIL
ncbi:CRISPR-associated endonuclease Cas2 [Halanaerobacter jeridensis]|uniref:CRISPR-associated endoribonuclease Cas2 n=1 Tax=Halanaerobacter jeridensis TaxID=706427 RepID=A0A938XRU4_9FIRM|nr:CRISPR-associated endonuclease Cas2 [Halanaerobacter jeridensis]MBM7555649.1 CRISPR-associated protein Cas2 [Halanaerobacter jeridensis]